MLTIFDTIYVTCPDNLMPKMLRKGIIGEVLVGNEFANTKPTRSSIKISSARTAFGKYKDWYFHVNCEDPEFQPYDFANPTMTLDEHIRMVKRRNTLEVLKYTDNLWMSFSGIGPEFSKNLDPEAFHQLPVLPSTVEHMHKSIVRSLKNTIPNIALVDLKNCKHIEKIPKDRIKNILPHDCLVNIIS